LFSAVRDGFVRVDFLKEQVDRGWVRPSLTYQLERGITDPLMLPSHISRRDLSEFVPPHRAGKHAKSAVGLRAAPGAMQRLALRGYARARYVAGIVTSQGRKAKRMVWSRNVKV
jgi:hypothetical protein